MDRSAPAWPPSRRTHLSALLAACVAPALAFSQAHEANVVLLNDRASAIHGEYGDSRRVAFVDLDADGDLDLFVLNYDQHNEIYLQGASGAFTPSLDGNLDLRAARPAKGVVFADFDGDGDQDVYIALGNDQPNVALRNLSEAGGALVGTFAPWDLVDGELDRHSYDAAAGDLDGDGRLDLIVVNRYQPHDLFLQDQGTDRLVRQAHAEVERFSHGSREVDLFDADLDGDLEILVANSTAENNELLVNLGGRQGGPQGDFAHLLGDPLTSAGGRSYGLAEADLNGDGLPEVAVANRNEANSIYRNVTAPGAQLPAFERVVGTLLDVHIEDSYDVEFGDLEGDGDVDLVVVNRMANNAVYLALGPDPLVDGWVRVQDGPLVEDTGNSRSIAMADVYAYGEPVFGDPVPAALEIVMGNTGNEPNWIYRAYGPTWQDALEDTFGSSSSDSNDDDDGGKGKGGSGDDDDDGKGKGGDDDDGKGNGGSGDDDDDGAGKGNGKGPGDGPTYAAKLTGKGTPRPGEDITLSVKQAPESRPAALVAAIVPESELDPSGPIFVDLGNPGVLFVHGLQTDAKGKLEFNFTLPADLNVDSGLQVLFQMLIKDEQAPYGLAASNVVKMTIME